MSLPQSSASQPQHRYDLHVDGVQYQAPTSHLRSSTTVSGTDGGHHPPLLHLRDVQFAAAAQVRMQIPVRGLRAHQPMRKWLVEGGVREGGVWWWRDAVP
eukprot:EC714826.1.p3 GENE.EC714826.1~~EC714826.1.p3  ORF type:complete len:100 (+),score=6.32 EC714826.1:143-442(+)